MFTGVYVRKFYMIFGNSSLTLINGKNMIEYRLFVEKARKNKNGESGVYLIVSASGTRFKVHTGLSTCGELVGDVFPKEDRGARMKTACLRRMLSDVDVLIYSNPRMPAEKLKKAVRDIVGGKTGGGGAEDSLGRRIREFAMTKDRGSTAKIYLRTAKEVEEFDKDVSVENVNVDWLNRFQSFMRGKGLKPNGASLHLRNVRAVFNWCIDNDVTENYPFRRFSIKSEVGVINNISAQQLADLRDYPVDSWQRIYRDLFMLSFYLCGMNPVDLLTCKSLTNGRMVYRRRKTDKMYNLPVVPEAMAIIEKYRGKGQLLSPMDCYGKYEDFKAHWNKALKKIGDTRIVPDKVGKMRKVEYHPMLPNISLYTARYTFASIAAELDIPRETIALCLGHSWVDVTSHYIAYDTRKIDDAVRKVVDYVNSLKGRFR